MQLDRNNFPQHIDLILKEIQQAHFIAFDCQFTGLVTQLEHIEGAFPNQLEFYQRIKETAINFNLLQLGITTFQYHDGQYYPKAYNFYVSAQPRKSFNNIILAEWESMAFLAKNGMDFGHAFKNGIEYKQIYGEKINTQLINPLQMNLQQPKVFYNENDRKLIKEIECMLKIQKQMRVNFKSKRIFDYFRNNYDMSFDKPKKNMEKYQYSVKVYDKVNIVFEEEEKAQKKEIKQETMLNQFCEKVQDITLEEKPPQVPLTLEVVINKIIECGKPIVGHFPNLDLGLIYQSFIADLPETYEEFSNHINKYFPYIFDTKILSRHIQSCLKSIKVDLKSLYRACFNPKLLQPYANINYQHVEQYLKEESSHEAGYDSFMTGCACIGMLNYLYGVKNAPFVFSNAHHDNKVLYSRFAGEISLIGPEFSKNTEKYRETIVIFPERLIKHKYQEIGGELSKYGTLTVHENHGETYYVFDEPQNIQDILLQFKDLKGYDKRALLKARRIFQ